MNRSKLIIILSSAILCVVTILCVMLIMILPSLTENTNHLIFISDTLESYYDGSVLKGEKWSMISGELKSGHKAEVTLSGSQLYVGTSKNLMRVRIVDSSGADVSSDYNIECVPGDLTVKPVNLTITSNSNMKVYDGEPLSDDGYTVVPAYTVPPMHELDVEITGEITEIGETGNTVSRVAVYDADGKDVTFNFNIIIVEGRLVVTDKNGMDNIDLNLDTDGDGNADLNLDIDGDMFADLNIDLNGDMLGDLNLDIDGDMLPDLNMDLDGDMLGDLNIDLDGDMIPDLNVDFDGDMLPELNVDLDSDMLPELNVDTNGDMLPELNIDTNGDMLPELNVDLDSDMLPELNVDTDGDLIPDVNVDTNGDMIPNLNIDIDGDMVPDLNIDTDGDGIPDKNVGNSNNSGFLDISGNIGAGDVGDLGAGALSSVVCYRVTSSANGTVYLKITNFGSYSGQKWGTPNEYDELIDSSYSASYLSSMAMYHSGRRHNTLVVEILNEQGVMPYYADIYNSQFIASSDTFVSYEEDTMIFVYFSGGYEGLSLPDELAFYEERYRDFVYNNYLEIDAETYDYMQKIIEANGFSASDGDVIKAVASYIQNAAKYDLKYDRALDKEDNIAIQFLDKYKSGICQHYASAATLLYRALGIPARYTVGFVCNSVAGETVEVTAMQAHAWVEVYIDGIGWIAVEVTGSDGSTGGPVNPDGSDGPQDDSRKITLTPAFCKKRYDGQPLVAENKLQATEALSYWIARGYTFVPVVSGERTEPGKSESVITDIRVYNPIGEDVTEEFDIECRTGVVHVYIEQLHFASASVEKEYDGIVLEGDASDVTFTGGYLPFGYTWVATPTPTASVKDVDSCQNSFNVKIFNEQGDDVTDMYAIVRQCGTLEIVPRSITVTAGSATASYTGEALFCNEISITSGELLEGDYIFDYVVEGSQTDRGRSDNVVKSITIYDQNGNDVTKNYHIIFEKGILRVTS